MEADNPAPRELLSVLPADDASNYHVLSAEEAEIVRMYRNLNELGQISVQGIMKSLCETHPGEEANPTAKDA